MTFPTTLSSAMEHVFQLAGLTPLADGSYFDDILTLAELDKLASATHHEGKFSHIPVAPETRQAYQSALWARQQQASLEEWLSFLNFPPDWQAATLARGELVFFVYPPDRSDFLDSVRLEPSESPAAAFTRAKSLFPPNLQTTTPPLAYPALSLPYNSKVPEFTAIYSLLEL